MRNLIGESSSALLNQVNLPVNGTAGTSRRGIEVGFIPGQMNVAGNTLATPGIINGTGIDFVIFEVGGATTAEPIMVRVGHSSQGNPGAVVFTNWYYAAPDHSTQLLSGSNYMHAFEYDLSNLGLAGDDIAVSIQIANMISTDRIDGSNETTSRQMTNGTDVGEGWILPGDGSLYSSSTLGPDPSDYNTSYNYPYGTSSAPTATSGLFDPDPAYLAVLSDLVDVNDVPEPTSLIVFGVGLLMLLGPRRYLA